MNSETEELSTKRKWNPKDAKINISSLLNDPRKVKRDYDLFTKTWGENFKEYQGSLIPKSIRLPSINHNHFTDYLDQTKDKFFRHKSQQLCDECNDETPFELPFGKNENTNFKLSMNAFNQPSKLQLVTRSALEMLPKMFLRPDFNLEQPETFGKVLSFSCQQSSSSSTFHDHGKSNFHQMSTSKLLQEQLSHYLDLVEVAIVRQISVQSDAFFNAMSSHDVLNDYLSKLNILTQHMRQKLAIIKRNISSKSLQVIKLHKQHAKHKLVLEKMVTMVTIHQAQPTIQLLLSTSEYSGALDLINTTQDVLKQEMQGIHCLRHLSSQLAEMGKVIIQMMLKEMTDYIKEDLQRPLDDGRECLDCNKLMALTSGLLRQRRLDFLEDLREEIQLTVRFLIKQTVLEVVETIENVTKLLKAENEVNGHTSDTEVDNTEQENETTLAERMRRLCYDDWLILLKKIFHNLAIFLGRIKAILSTIEKTAHSSCRICSVSSTENNEAQSETKRTRLLSFRQTSQTLKSPDVVDNYEEGLWDDMDAYEASLMESVDNKDPVTIEENNLPTNDVENKTRSSSSSSNSNEPNSKNEDISQNTLLSVSEYEEVCKHIQENYQWAIEYQNDRCVKVIIARGKHGSLDKLAASEFLSLAQAVEEYIKEIEQISNEDDKDDSSELFYMEGIGVGLKDIIKSHASMFINRFHEERRNKLSLILDNETWKQAEVPSELSKLLQAMSDGKLSSSTKDIKSINNGINGSEKETSLLTLDGQKYCVVGTVLLLLKIVSEYCRCAEDLPSSTADLVTRLAELLTLFNSRTCQLVLGAGALQIAGLKTITTKNLALASRCLQLVLHFIPTVRSNFESKLKQSNVSSFNNNINILKRFDHCAKDYKAHITEIDNKLLSIMETVLDMRLEKWEVKAPVPSVQIKTICKQIGKLYDTIDGLLQEDHCKNIITRIHANFKLRLRKKLKIFNIQNDGGPRHGLVMSDVAFYEGSMKNLRGFKTYDFKMQSIWM